MKDILCGSQPLNSFSVKYGTTKGRIALPLQELGIYSRQILEALKYLHSNGLPYGLLLNFARRKEILTIFNFAGHLTTANVFIENGTAKLSAIENFVLGVPSFYR